MAIKSTVKIQVNHATVKTYIMRMVRKILEAATIFNKEMVLTNLSEFKSLTPNLNV